MEGVDIVDAAHIVVNEDTVEIDEYEEEDEEMRKRLCGLKAEMIAEEWWL